MPGLVRDVKWNEDNDLEAAPTLSKEEEETLRNRMAAMDKILADQKKAKYKIEIAFGSRRSGRAAYPGALSLWESGAKFHGGGDTKVYECPATALKKGDCHGLIPDSSQGYGYLVCPDCKKVWKGTDVHGEIFARLTTQNWAFLIYKYFVRLGHNADIYMKLPRIDIRKAAQLEQDKQLMGEQLVKARKRELVLYPLRNIVKDVGSGADPLKRFTAFLSS